MKRPPIDFRLQQYKGANYFPDRSNHSGCMVFMLQIISTDQK